MTVSTSDSARSVLKPAAALFHSLADPARLGVLQILMSGEKRVAEITEQLGLAQSTVSQHLACLRECELVAVRPVGRSSLYSLTHPELFDLLRSAERLLDATGESVTLCKNYGAASR
ncbi:MAG: ArsR/SmtB family transcription factor [Microcella sp.]|jgi:DNA-binding transcriptional ArsR family regulator|uniref:DNA-binding transcriptional ArsR family regulator n=1 Tax=Microcella frigidaquae TaxID=424758 RepID=A0A840XAP7_9MICO|nr:MULTISPECIES: metalloregulator ArsR/SmtB family transcription factor [Microcella]MBB5618254.1 DNA-binding transcriptional ArsR family regulator [Microcella frigidaquae]MDX2024936.1 metalloregulator ArsR/SmtB family transcription factor [Microcella sp.]NHN45874.1 winged helix-turn-helix transcriptional regulator [Microcella frigidaquae]